MNPETDNLLNGLLERAAHLRDEGELEAASAIIELLMKSYPDDKAALLVAGHFYWEYGSIDRAVGTFEKATALFQESKLASLGLFHVLWKAGLHQRALEEAERFTSGFECEEYDQLLEDMSASMNAMPSQQTGKNRAK